jgi:anion-transporting  ArsA/GET3 family ATPase
VNETENLGPLLDGRRVVLVVGCGGVGKTTTTAALGLAAARRGRRVLCLTIDPARRLAQSLGLSWSSTDAREVNADLLARAGVPPEGSLTIMRVDTKATFDQLVAQLAPTPERRDRILGNVLYHYISTSLAGTQEYMAMERLYALRDDPRYDLVLLDTPPTTNALDFLDAPERLAGAIESPAIKWLSQAFESSGRFSFDLVARSAASLLKGLGKLAGGGFLEQVAEFVSEMNALFGGWTARAATVAAALRGPDVAYVLVTTPDPLALREVRFFAERLERERMHADAFVVNRVHPGFPERPPAPRVDGLDAASAHAIALFGAAALDDARRLARIDRLNLLQLESAPGADKTIQLVVPTFATDVYELDSLGEIAAILAPARDVRPAN